MSIVGSPHSIVRTTSAIDVPQAPIAQELLKKAKTVHDIAQPAIAQTAKFETIYEKIKGHTQIKIEGSIAFRTKIHAYIAKLCTEKIGIDLLSKIIESKKPLTISEGAESQYSNGRIYMNISEKVVLLKKDKNGENCWYEREIFIGFAHELIHFWHVINNDYRSPTMPSTIPNFDNLEDQYTITGKDENGSENPFSEWAICKAFGEPLRMIYFCSAFPFIGPVNERKPDDRTRIHEAIWHGALASVKKLVAQNADMTALFRGMTPLQYAISVNQTDIVNFLTSALKSKEIKKIDISFQDLQQLKKPTKIA